MKSFFCPPVLRPASGAGLEALGAHFDARARPTDRSVEQTIAKFAPLEIGVFANRSSWVIMTAEERTRAALDRSFAADCADVCHMRPH